MRRILNDTTRTVHKPCEESDSKSTACGSLRHVPETRTKVVSAGEIRIENGITRCGRCFDDAGGY